MSTAAFISVKLLIRPRILNPQITSIFEFNSLDIASALEACFIIHIFGPYIW